MKQNKKSLYFILACLLITFIPYSRGVYAESVKREKITIAQFGKERFLLYLPLYVAIDEGFFDKRGIDVDLKFAGNDDQVFASVISGNADFGIADPAFVAISHDKGGPGKIVGLMLTSLATRGVTNNDAVPVLKNPKDLAGWKVSSLPAPSSTYALLNNIKNKFHLDTFTIVQTPIGGQMPLLEAGKVDIATDLEPNISLYEDKGYRPVLDITSWVPPQAITSIITNDDTIKKRKEMVQRVVDSLQEAIDLMYKNHNLAYTVAKKMYPQLSDTVIHNAVESLLHRHIYPNTIALDDGLWQRTLQAHIDSGELKKPQSLTESVDNHFAIRARTDLIDERTIKRK